MDVVMHVPGSPDGRSQVRGRAIGAPAKCITTTFVSSAPLDQRTHRFRDTPALSRDDSRAARAVDASRHDKVPAWSVGPLPRCAGPAGPGTPSAGRPCAGHWRATSNQAGRRRVRRAGRAATDGGHDAAATPARPVGKRAEALNQLDCERDVVSTEATSGREGHPLIAIRYPTVRFRCLAARS